MSLTSELKQKDSFARRFIDERFPHLKTIARECNREIRSRGLDRIARIHDDNILYRLVGTAVDYRVRAYFNRHIDEAGAVTHGLTLLCNLKELEKPWVNPDGNANFWADNGSYWVEEMEVVANPWYWRRRKRVAERFLSSFRNFVAKVRPERRRLTVEAEEKLCRYCILFAYLDWIYRAPYYRGNSTYERMVRLGSPKVESMLRAVDANVVADLVSLSTLFYQQQADLLKKFKKVAVGGNFIGGGDVGGADFDLIVDGCLIDLKTALRPKIDAVHLRQLVGYWLLDYDDAWHMTSAAIVLTRHGHVRRFDIRNLIGSNVNAAVLRSEFRAGLRSDG